MNKLNTVAAFAVAIAAIAATASAGPAFADDITADNQTFVSTKTRADVKAEMLLARADGSMATWMAEAGSAPVTLAMSRPASRPASRSLTREEVVADMRVNREASIASAAMVGEDSGSFYLSQVARPGVVGNWQAKLTRAGH